MQQAAARVFSKHRRQDIREWSKLLMSSYQLLHAVEKPMNLEHIQTPFASTSDLKDMTPVFVKNKKYWREKDANALAGEKPSDEPVIDLDEKK